MPVVLRIRGYRFWFYSADLDEPPHVHVGKDGMEAKFWLVPVTVARSGRFRSHEIREIADILMEHQALIVSTWYQEQMKRGSR